MSEIHNFGDKIFLYNFNLDMSELHILRVLTGNIARGIINNNPGFSNLNITKLKTGLEVLVNYKNHYDKFIIEGTNIYMSIGKIPSFLQKL